MGNQRPAFGELGQEGVVIDGQCSHGRFEDQGVQPLKAECFRNIGHVLFQSNTIDGTHQLSLKAVDV